MPAPLYTPMLHKAVLYLRMIKFSHSLFALPFAFTSVLLAAKGLPSLNKIIWITAAMVCGRSSAMGMNRIIDRKTDLLNPRTAGREIPSGKIRYGEALLFVLISTALFEYSAYRLNLLCLILSPIALFFFIFYPYAKRFTWMSHIVLGAAIAGAPAGAWIAVRGGFDPEILPLVAAVLFWLAGFDIIYALQDREFDSTHGLHSIPERFGVRKALLLSRIFHILTWGLLLYTALIFSMGVVFYIGLAAVAGFLVYEQIIVRKGDLERLDMAFFNMNGYISLTVFVCTALDMLVIGQ